MNNGMDYDLSRLAYREWNEQFKNQYVPLPEQQSSWMQRIFAAMRNARSTRANGNGELNKKQPATTGAIAK
jgi:hypothetical protein